MINCICCLLDEAKILFHLLILYFLLVQLLFAINHFCVYQNFLWLVSSLDLNKKTSEIKFTGLVTFL
ncbi:MAG TPA: hypothetical protein DER05_07290 [Lutibacter sp.]|nr:hypothetical protein [Lutibacter sp.]